MDDGIICFVKIGASLSHGKPQPHRQHNHTIMEDIQAYHFPHQKAIQLNTVWLFLWINYLSEITDHTGTQLLPHTLQPLQPHKPLFYYDNPNQSSLIWPHQPLPGQTAWKQWHEVITWMYATTDGSTLQQPLGPWLHQYDQDFQWNWIIQPPTQDLYPWYGTQWHVYWLLWQTNTYIKYPAQPITHPQLPKNSQLATPTLHPRHIQLVLPIPNQMIPPPVPETLPPTLAQHLHTPPHKWSKPLWHHILHHAPLGQLKQAIVQHHPILLVSDASVSACQTSTCTWVIWSTTQLWSGKGIVPSTTNDLYSRLAEAYGIYTVLQFFQTSTSAPFCLYCHIWWL